MQLSSPRWHMAKGSDTVCTHTQGEHKSESVVPVQSLKYIDARFVTETYTCGLVECEGAEWH